MVVCMDWCIAGERAVSDRETGELKHGTKSWHEFIREEMKPKKKKSNNLVQLLYFRP